MKGQVINSKDVIDASDLKMTSHFQSAQQDKKEDTTMLLA